MEGSGIPLRFRYAIDHDLNRCHRYRGFVYHRATFSEDRKGIEVSVRPRKDSAAICLRCHQPASGYDQLHERRFVFLCSDMWEPYLKVNDEEPIMRRNVLGASKEGVSNTIC